MSDPILQTTKLTVHYPAGRAGVVRAVDGVDLVVRAGEVLGIVGESGCGKSSLGRAVLRLESITAGQVFAFGEDITTLPERRLRRTLRRRTAMIFQDPHASLNPRMTIGAAVAEPLRVHGIGDRDAKVRALLERVGLDPQVAERRPHAFSGGQLQRVGIARALALEPDLIVADEAVSALDVSVQAGIINLMADLQAERGLAWIFISHDLEVVRHICQRVAVMYLGRIVEEGPAERVFNAPQHPYTRALLASVPRPDPHARQAPAALTGEPPSPLDPPTGCAFHPRCPIAQEQCSVQRPELKSVADGQNVACSLVSIADG